MSAPTSSTEDSPKMRTGIGHFLFRTPPPPRADTFDIFVPAQAREHQGETLKVAAFVALWSFAATGCLLPWGGMGHTSLLAGVVCLLAWIPVWFFGMVLCLIIPGALIYPFLFRGIVDKETARTLCSVLACLIFTAIALSLAGSMLLHFRVIGWIWLLVLSAEALIRFVRLFAKIRL